MDKQTKQEFVAIKKLIKDGFKQVNKRFEQVDGKFESLEAMIDNKIEKLAMMVKVGFDENSKEHAEMRREIEIIKLKLAEKVDRSDLEKRLFSLRQS